MPSLDSPGLSDSQVEANTVSPGRLQMESEATV